MQITGALACSCVNVSTIGSHLLRFAGLVDEVKLSSMALAPGAGFLWGP